MYNSNFYGGYNNPQNNERVGFLGPFLLGGIAGGLTAPLFYNNGYGYRPYNNYYYNYYQPYPYPYPYYYRNR